MTNEQAYIEGFVKRANEYGYSESEAVGLYKEATRWRDEMLKGNILVHPSTSGGYRGASFGDNHIGENTFNPPKDYTKSLNYLEDDIKGLPSSSKNNWDISKGTMSHPESLTERNKLNKYREGIKNVRETLNARPEKKLPSPYLSHLLERNERKIIANEVFERMAREEAAQQAVYGAAKGVREVIHPPSGLMNKLKSFLRKK